MWMLRGAARPFVRSGVGVARLGCSLNGSPSERCSEPVSVYRCDRRVGVVGVLRADELWYLDTYRTVSPP